MYHQCSLNKLYENSIYILINFNGYALIFSPFPFLVTFLVIEDLGTLYGGGYSVMLYQLTKMEEVKFMRI